TAVTRLVSGEPGTVPNTYEPEAWRRPRTASAPSATDHRTFLTSIQIPGRLLEERPRSHPIRATTDWLSASYVRATCSSDNSHDNRTQADRGQRRYDCPYIPRSVESKSVRTPWRGRF